TPTSQSWATSSLSYSRSPNARSPPPLANDRYELAGGMENSDRFARQANNYDDYFHLEKQRGMWPNSPPAGLPNQLPVDGNQLPVDGVDTSPGGSKPWMLNQIMNIVGGVAGKLFEFCAVPFRGFQAGGGQGYTVDDHGEIAAKLGLQDDPSTEPPGSSRPQGNYPEDNFGVQSIESLESERPRMAKRLRTGDNWVVVDKEGGMNSRPSTPRLAERRLPPLSRSPSQIPRPASRASFSTPVSRPSLIPVSRRSTLDRKPYYSPSGHAKSYSTPQPRSYGRLSYGSPSLFDDNMNSSRSPLPAESQRLISKWRREEIEDEARMRRMSSQMDAMLKEAREALGQKVEIEDDFVDDNI
ncbi:hypothetical protein BS50DRAFT_464454, partial [Corynespora cassiicola Philippines]